MWTVIGRIIRSTEICVIIPRSDGGGGGIAGACSFPEIVFGYRIGRNGIPGKCVAGVVGRESINRIINEVTSSGRSVEIANNSIADEGGAKACEGGIPEEDVPVDVPSRFLWRSSRCIGDKPAAHAVLPYVVTGSEVGDGRLDALRVGGVETAVIVADPVVFQDKSGAAAVGAIEGKIVTSSVMNPRVSDVDAVTYRVTGKSLIGVLATNSICAFNFHIVECPIRVLAR